jgi:hypothetical protein
MQEFLPEENPYSIKSGQVSVDVDGRPAVHQQYRVVKNSHIWTFLKMFPNVQQHGTVLCVSMLLRREPHQHLPVRILLNNPSTMVS